MEPTQPLPASGGPPRPPERDRPWPAIILGALAAILAIVLIVVLATDDDEDVSTDDTTTTEQTTTTTEAETTTTTTEATTTTEEPTDTTVPGGISDAEAATVVWPEPGDMAHQDPVDAATEFAEDVLGFVNPVYSEFMQGDSRSGEIEVRAQAEGPATTIGVRQMSDDSWYVLFAASSEVELSEPAPGSAIDTPLQVAGQSRSFEGQVRIVVFERGQLEPLGEGFVTGGSGEALEPFSGEIDWDNPGGGRGAVAAITASGRDGTTWAAAALPVGFIGGD